MHSPAVPPTASARRRPRWLALLALLGGLGLAGLGAGTVYIQFSRPAAVTVTDHSGVVRFNFRVTGIPVPGLVPDVQVQASWTPRDLSRASATASVDLRRLNTGIALRDVHARRFLGVDRHPQATYTLQALEGPRTLRPGGAVGSTTRGTLNLNGVERPLVSRSTLTLDRSGQHLEVITHFNVVFADYHISIPGADASSDVTVEFRLPVRS